MTENQVLWAVVELMGHVTIAGRVSASTSLGVPLVRIDVPGFEGQEEHSELIGGNSIYRVVPCSEEYARNLVAYLKPKPLSVYIPPTRQIGGVVSEAEIDEYLDDEGDYDDTD